MGDTKNENQFAYNTMSLGDHLEELRRRLIFCIGGIIVGAIVCLYFGSEIVSLIKHPYITITAKLGFEANLQTLSPAAGFTSFMKIALISGLIVSCPWVFYHLWMFVAAGLYPREKRYVNIAVPFSAILFVGGALFFLFIVAPLSLGFFLKFDKWFGVASHWTFPDYLSFVSTLMLVFGIGFQTPIAILILNKTGLVSISALNKSRKFVFFAVFVIAAFATPPDVISQVTLAIPLYLLFELGLVICYFAGRKKKS